MSRTWARSAFCVSRRYWTRAPAAQVAAAAIFEAEALQTVRLQLRQEGAARRFELERPVVHARHARRQAQGFDQRRRLGERPRRHDLARTQDGEFVGERLPRVAPAELGGGEFTRRQIQQRDAVARPRLRRRDAGQKRRLACVEVPGVGQRAGRDDAHDFAADQSLRLLRVLHLLADGDPEALLHQAGDVSVGRVVRDAAHRNGAAGRVLRSGGERQLEGARGGQRVLVEHLVEIPHAEEDDGIAVLPFRLEELPHGRRGAGGFGRHRGGRHFRELVRVSITLAY